MVFIAKLKKIIQVAMAFLDSMMAIANGVIGAAAAKVESTLAGLLVLAISFLAGFLGLNKIADKVMDIINTKVRAPVDKAIDFVINWIVTTAKNLFKALFGKKDKSAQPDTRTPEEKQRALQEGIAAALAIATRRGTTREAVERALPPIAQRLQLRVLRTVDHGESSYRIHGEVNPEDDSRDLPKVLTVERAVALARRNMNAGQEQFELSVASVEDARAVIAQVFPAAREMPSPTAGSPYQSAIDARNIEAFREFRQRALAFHIDVQRYNVAEIRNRLREEIGEVTANRNRARTEIKYHDDHPAWSARNQDSRRGSERNLGAATERLGNLQDIMNNLSSHQPEWAKLEKEGVLLGHATVDPAESRHRTNPHVNVEGRVQWANRVETLELFIKVAIYVVSRRS
jgi:hypothetical protein